MLYYLFVLLYILTVLTICLYIIYKPPFSLIRYFQRRFPDVLWHVHTTEKIIALTIDDSPSIYTREILSILQANDATATFFVIGSQVIESDSNEATLSDVVRMKNELGNHAMHDFPSIRLTDDGFRAEIREVDGMIREAYATAAAAPANSFSSSSSNDGGTAIATTSSHHPSQAKSEPGQFYFRPGSGFFNRRMRNIVNELGYRLVLGSVYPFDAQISYPRINSRYVLSEVRPGSIIICHDRRSWTAPMLRKVLPELKRRGYRVVTVSQLLRETSS